MAALILIPAYNAGATVAAVANECLVHGHKVLIVDDGSTDGTAAQLEPFPVVILSHGTNRGKGAALRTGFAWALENGYNDIITLDADGQHDPGAIPLLLEQGKAGNFGILIASRRSQFEEMSGLRSFWNRFGVWCMKKRTGFAIEDSQSGFRYYSAALLRAVTVSATGYNLEMEILLKGWRAGFRLGSLPVPARVADGRSTSHFRPVRDTWNICMTFLKHM